MTPAHGRAETSSVTLVLGGDQAKLGDQNWPCSFNFETPYLRKNNLHETEEGKEQLVRCISLRRFQKIVAHQVDFWEIETQMDQKVLFHQVKCHPT